MLGKSPLCHVNPDTVVVQGAAIQEGLFAYVSFVLKKQTDAMVSLIKLIKESDPESIGLGLSIVNTPPIHNPPKILIILLLTALNAN